LSWAPAPAPPLKLTVVSLWPSKVLPVEYVELALRVPKTSSILVTAILIIEV
jgi:hypothetical protein